LRIDLNAQAGLSVIAYFSYLFRMFITHWVGKSLQRARIKAPTMTRAGLDAVQEERFSHLGSA